MTGSHVERLNRDRWKVRETTFAHLEDALRGLRVALIPTPNEYGMQPYEAELAVKGIERIAQNLKEEQEAKLKQAGRAGGECQRN